MDFLNKFTKDKVLIKKKIYIIVIFLLIILSLLIIFKKDVPDMSELRGEHKTIKLKDGRVLLIGGYNYNKEGHRTPVSTLEIYNPKANKFTTAKNSLEGIKRDEYSATLLKDGRVLIIGGINKSNTEDIVLKSLKSTKIYDPKKNLLTDGPDLNIPRGRHSSILLDDGKVLVTGGINFCEYSQRKIKQLEPLNKNFKKPRDKKLKKIFTYAACQEFDIIVINSEFAFTSSTELSVIPF